MSGATDAGGMRPRAYHDADPDQRPRARPRTMGSRPPRFALRAAGTRALGAPPVGWSGEAKAASLVSRAQGAGFDMTLVRAQRGAVFQAPRSVTLFAYVVQGAARVAGVASPMVTGSFVSATALRVDVLGDDTAIVFIVRSAKPTAAVKAPPIVGSAAEVRPEPRVGSGPTLRVLMRARDGGSVCAVHVADFASGQTLSEPARPRLQHGALVLDGRAVCMLGLRYLPVETGTFVWVSIARAYWRSATNMKCGCRRRYLDCSRYTAWI